MKKIVYYLVILGLVFTGCDPNEDIYNAIDAQANPIVGDAMYTLTSDDYDDLELDFGSFSSEDDAKAALPDFLSDLYPIWGLGSSVLVGYELYIGNAEGVSDYSGADVYELGNDDYAATGSDAYGFYPNVDSNDHIPGILTDRMPGATEGQIVLAQYEQYFNDPEVGLANVYEAVFPANFDDFENIDVLGAQGWTAGSSYANGSGFDGANNDNEDWLISPEIDLTGETEVKFQISQRISFLGAGTMTDHVNILVATDYTGDQNTATWNTITLAMAPDGSTSDFVVSEDYDFSAFDGQTVHVAFKLETTVATSPLWRIEWFALKTIGVDGETDSKGTHFVYEGGEWEPVDGVYFLSSSDFDSMGEGSGQPGRFDNFGSSTPAGDYLPTFFGLTTPFAFGQDGDEIIAVYDYFSSSSGAQIRGNLYTMMDGVWVEYQSTISTTLQFGHDGTTWVPDNTIRYSLTGADYTAVADALIAEPGFEAAAGNLANFGNFNRTGGSTTWSDAMLVTALGVVLNNIDAGAADGQKYVMTFDVYIGSNSTESFAMIKDAGEWVLQ